MYGMDMTNRTYFRPATDIVAYVFQADIRCPDCTVERLIEMGLANEHALTFVAHAAIESAGIGAGIDVMDESSFDSEDFPKVVFASDVEDDENCARCACEF